MEFYLSRAIQIASMDEIHIERLHGIETKRGFCLSNWNIQSMFGLPTLKERWGIPDNEIGQANHAERIRQRIKELGLLLINAPGLVDAMNLEKVHTFDKLISDKRDVIDFGFHGARSGKRLSDKVAEAIS